MPWLLCTGDDEGVIKLWDPRQRECIRTYKQHFDYITDFLWLKDTKQLVATSGDGTLSVMDVRSKKVEAAAHSEDQEDELLSVALIRGGAKVVVGTQLGILSIFNRASGWGDCTDRVPGHPHSVDSLATLPLSFPYADTTSLIFTGSSDGFVRAMQILPTKLLGVVVDHGDWPVERIAIGCGPAQLNSEEQGPNADKDTDGEGEYEELQTQHKGQWWMASIGHDEILKMTDLSSFFCGLRKDETEAGKKSDGDRQNYGVFDDGVNLQTKTAFGKEEDHSEDELQEQKPTKRKRKPEKNPLVVTKKKGRNTVDVEPSFFDGL